MPRSPLLRRALVMGAAVIALVVAGVVSERRGRADNVPYVPRSPDEIVERLPLGRESATELELLQKAAAAAPSDPAHAAAFAERCIRESRRTGDPRYLGRARAALAPFWNDPAAPPRIVLLRATIKQSLHDFSGALADLDALALAKTGEGDPQVALTRGVVLYVMGRYAEARASCNALRSPSSGLAFAVCRATVDSVTGKSKEAYASLSAFTSRTADDEASRAERAWALSTLGEIAVRAGNDGAAERHLRAALEADPDDLYTRAALSDLLLDLDRPGEVPAVVGARTEDDGLLLRLAIAEARSKSKLAKEHRELLAQRHEASLARGDVVHRREQARFELELQGHEARALEIALANFEVQKEPWDLRLVLETALAARRPETARVALAFLATSGAEEPRLRALAARFPK